MSVLGKRRAAQRFSIGSGRKKTAPRTARSAAPLSKRRPSRNDEDDLENDDDDEEEEEKVATMGRREGEEEDDAFPSSSVDSAVNDVDVDAETGDETRVRLARSYLDQIKAQTSLDSDEEEEGEDEERERPEVDAQLKKEASGLNRTVWHTERLRDELCWASIAPPRSHRVHRLPATCVALSRDDRFAYSGSKDGSVVEIDVETGKKLSVWLSAHQAKKSSSAPTLVGHRSGVSAIACSTDQRFLASGDVNGIMRVFDSRLSPDSRHSLVLNTSAHKSTISGMCFRANSNTLFTSSHDRTVKVWDVSQPNPYVETLFGHTSAVNAVDAGSRLTCVTASSDKTARFWRVEQETQLLFRAEAFAASLDAITMMNESSFVVGGEDGSIHHWLVSKKKPTDIVVVAHGGSWITSLTHCPASNIVMSGSSDGFINLYEISPRNKLLLLKRVPLQGYINGLVCANSARFLLAGVGQEHRAGRWLTTNRAAKNGMAIVPLPSIQ